MYLSEQVINLLLFYTTTSNIVFFLHDSSGNYIASFPEIDPTQHNYYANTDFYKILINESIRNNYPHVYSGHAADNWSCIPIVSVDDQIMYLIIGPVYT